jgi:ribonuclease P/MRP protein subunit POP5
LKRVKRRYLALTFGVDGLLSRGEFLDAAWAAITRLFGEYGASQTGMSLISFDGEKKTATVRVSLVTLQQVRAAFASITRISGKEAAVHVTAVSGTLKSLHSKTED